MDYIQFSVLVLQLIGTILLGIDVLEKEYKKWIEEKIKEFMSGFWSFLKVFSIWFILVSPVSIIGGHIDSPVTPIDTLASAFPPDSVGNLVIALGIASYPGVLYIWMLELTKDIWNSTAVKTILLLLSPLLLPLIILALLIFMVLGAMYASFKPIHILERKNIISSSVRLTGLLLLIFGTIIQTII